MARRTRPVRGAGRGGEGHFTYARFMGDLLSGEIVATALIDTRVPDGVRQVPIAQSDEDGRPLPPLIVSVPQTRVVAMAYDEPVPGPPGSPGNGANR